MPTARRRSAPRLAVAFALIAALASLALASSALGAPGVAFAPVSARNEPDALGGAGVVKGAAIDTFKYIVNVDNTGTTETRGPTGVCSPEAAGYPASCHWTSIAGVPGSAPIATQGDQSDFAGGATIDLPDGRYLVSVLADGFKLDGEHFTVQGGAIVSGPRNAAGKLVVEMQPTPVPDSTVRAFVFQDNAPVNGQDDGNAEPGLPGFEGQLNDYLGQIVTDVYGNPLCTWYHGQDPTSLAIPRQDLDADGLPVPAEDERPAGDPSSPGHCVSDADGILTIPHMGTNRYALSVIAPNGTDWVQTTTLEGNHDWDAWVMEGSTGFDTEFAVAGEPVPTPIFGFVKPTALSGPGTAHVKGVVDAMKVYVPAVGGLTNGGSIWGGLQGAKIDHPIDRPWIALSDLSGGDQAVYVGRGNADGSFDIANVPDGDYQITWWDDPQDYILDLQNVTVANGQVEDLGILPLAGWWTQFEGHVFNDLNANGKRDPGEPGVKDFGLVLKKRENSLMDRGTTGTTTAPDGSYYFEGAYPMTQWLVMEAYSDRYYTTGITYQADNQPTETTVLGAGVDVSVHPVIGLSGRLDWGVRPYAPNTNGGIVGTVSYDTTRNELDPRYAAVEDWQPGIPDLPVDLYEPVPCGTNAGAPCTTTPAGDEYEVETDGSYAKGRLLNQYLTENWQRPGLNDDGECIARDVNGDPLPFGSGQLVTDAPTDCLEAPLMGVQFQKGFSTVDGNYGFGDGCFTGDGFDPATGGCADGSDPTALPPGDYLVSVEIPDDAQGRPLYKVTREEDVNIGNGDQTVPQVPPPACAGPLHTVDVAGQGTDGYGAVTNTDNPDVPAGVTVPATEATDNPTFADIGGSPYEGQQRPLCDTKLVPLANQRSIAPTFNYFTDVPLPGRLWGLLVDDLNFSADKKSALYGEKAGVPFAPVGVYDYTNRLVTTVESDYNGLWDVLLPSTNRINCPTPSGVCSNLYRFVGNDPGVPGRLNPNFKPEFRTIATEFEVFPGLLVPADLAPTQVGVTVQLPNGQTHRVVCALDDSTPQLMAVSRPYVDTRTAQDTVTIRGQGFGAAAGKVLLDDSVALPATAWSDTQITVSVPAATAQGPHQLDIVNQNGKKTVNGITFHVIGATYDPIVYEVGPDVLDARYRPANTLPDTANHAIQNAIDDAQASTSNRPKLIVVYPGLATADNPRVNPRGAYYENLVVSEPLKIQGTGPGGVRSDGTTVPGAILDGSAFGGDSAVAGDWQTRVGGMTWAGNQNVNDGAVVTLFAATETTFPATPTEANAPSIDGLDIRGGDQQGFPTNINQTGGGPTGLPPAIQTQGGAVFANGYARALRITNNVVENNGGAYGTIRIGTPDLPAPNTSNHDENVRIAKNRIIQNGGTNLAGGIGLFAGSDGYDVANNDICGNFSAEYGGGITAYGLSPNGRIHDNRIYFNTSYDEGGGIMVAGELPANPNALSPGSGPVSITHNQVQANLANDDGGGIRFLMAGNFAMNVSDNLIVNNVSAHEGGGVALDDAPQVRLVGNTIMKNLTTATAQTSNGLPAPAGLSTGLNSDQLQATLPSGSPTFSNPVQFDNVFWDNRAGSLDAAGAIVGLGAAGDATPVNRWDMGTADGSGTLAPTNSVIQTPAGAGSYTDAASNVHADPAVKATYDVSVDFAQWRTNPNFISPTMVAVDLPPNLLGDYHLSSGSPAINAGAASTTATAPGSGTVAAPADDFDHEARPGGAAFDIGADEIPGLSADLAITNAPDKTAASPGQAMTYTVVVTNNGPSAVTAAPVTGTKVTGSRLTLSGWTCTAGTGATCGAANGTITNQTAFGLGSVSLAKGATATITVTGTVNGTSASGSFTWTAAVAAPAGTTDPAAANNSAAAAAVSLVGPGSDLSIAKTRTQPTLTFGGPVTYTVTVTNNGPLSGTVTARVQDPVPAGLSGMTWTCDSTAPGSDCDTSGAMGTDVTTALNGGIDRQVRLAGGASLTFTVNGTAAASGALRNTATVTMTSGGNDRIPTNNTATDTATVPLTDVALPTLPILDRFNRANATTLGPDWNQVVLGGSAAVRVNGGNALALIGLTPWGTWKPTLTAGQGAAFTFVNAPANGSSLVLKGTGPITSTPTTSLRVQITGTNEVTVTSVLNGASTTRAVFAGSFAAGDRLAAAALGNGQVNVWKNSTLIGSVRIPTTSGNDGWTPGTGGGRIGIRLAIGQRIDDFSGGTVTP